jgi:hypothetical protein
MYATLSYVTNLSFFSIFLWGHIYMWHICKFTHMWPIRDVTHMWRVREVTHMWRIREVTYMWIICKVTHIWHIRDVTQYLICFLRSHVCDLFVRSHMRRHTHTHTHTHIICSWGRNAKGIKTHSWAIRCTFISRFEIRLCTCLEMDIFVNAFMPLWTCFAIHAFTYMASITCSAIHAFTYMASITCFATHAFTYMASIQHTS